MLVPIQLMHSNMPPYFILLLGAISLFADMSYEGAKSISGNYLQTLGATAAIVSLISGFGEFIGYASRVVFGRITDKTGKILDHHHNRIFDEPGGDPTTCVRRGLVLSWSSHRHGEDGKGDKGPSTRCDDIPCRHQDRARMGFRCPRGIVIGRCDVRPG